MGIKITQSKLKSKFIFKGPNGSNKKYGHKFYNDAYIEARAAARKEAWNNWKARVAIRVMKNRSLRMHRNGYLKRIMSERPLGQGKFGRKVFRANALAGRTIHFVPNNKHNKKKKAQ